MNCAGCGHDNRDAAKFCEECGRALTASGSVPPPSGPRDVRTYTPRHLAERILGDRAAMVGERKQVTVLFADIRGSMELAERIGAERWHQVLDRFFHLVNDAVHRFEGTVNQYTGDGVMALFGAPLAHEDHAHRACHAALQLRERLPALAQELERDYRLPFAVRMGLNSGEVVVGAIGDDLRMDYTAQGQSVGLAQRVEQLAAPNSAYLAHATASLVGDSFLLRDLGEFSVKGVRELVRVHELLGERPERARIDVLLARNGARFSGRRAEIGELERALDAAMSGQGQVVGVVGEPGIGKTRLCLELAAQCRDKGAVLAQAHCPTHAASVPWLPILELLRSLFGLHAEETAAAAQRKIRRNLIQLNKSFEEALPFVFDLLDVPDPKRPAPATGEDRGARIAALVRRIVQAQSASKPLVLLVDDVQCIDAAGDAILGEIVDALAWTRTLLLVNFRPGHRSAWMAVAHYRQLSLGALPEGEVEELLRTLVGDDGSTRELRQLIRDRTGGNPFFVEEVVRSLVDHGTLQRPGTGSGTGSEGRGPMRLMAPVTELAIPATVQALLAARLDRLPPSDKLVLQAASVIGQSFAPAVLRRLLSSEAAGRWAGEAPTAAAVDAALAALESAEFVRREGGPEETEYAFRHPLTQSVAYGSQLLEPRAQLHLGVAEALQAVHPQRLGQYASLVAHHLDAAGKKREAGRWRRRAALRVTNIELARPSRR